MSKTERIGFVVAFGLGLLVRLLPVAGSGSPVGDGGLILAMTDDLRASGLDLPAATTYNRLDIPFGYPPMGLLVAGWIGELTGTSTLDLLRWMPALFSLVGLAAFAWLAHRVLPPISAVGATLAYALMPGPYGWLVAGGGLTRGLGLLLALVAAALVADRRNQRIRTAVAAGAVLGFAGLVHPQAIVFGVPACIVFSWQRPVRAWLTRLAVAAAAAALVLIPWLIWIATTIGLDTLTGVSGRAEPVIGLVRLLNLRFSGAPFMDVIGVVGVIGLVVSLVKRSLRVPILLLTTYVLGAGGGEFLAAVPWALLAGVGFAALADIGHAALPAAWPKQARAVGAAIAGIALFLGMIGSLGSTADRSSKLHPLGQDSITAMQWLSEHAAANATVIVPTDEVWGFDDIGEWLPAISGRHSIGTVQGSEWLGRTGFEAQLAHHDDIRACAGQTATCYRAIDAGAYLFIPKGRLNGPFSPPDCCPALRTTLLSAGYQVVYDGPGATIALAED